MRIVYFGYQEPGFVCLRELLRIGEDVRLVVTHRDDPGETIWFGSVKRLAGSRKIPVVFSEETGWKTIEERVRALRPELVLSVYYRRVIPEGIMRLATLGAVNLHGSLLPRYRGRAPVNWAIIGGEKVSGFTFHFMEKKPDTGDIILQTRVSIGPNDRALDVYWKMARKMPRALARLIRMFRTGNVPRAGQDHDRATCFGRRTAEDGKIDWDRPAREIKDLVRAVTRPWPGAFTDFRGKRLFIWKADYRKTKRRPGERPGTLRSFSAKDGACVVCKEGILCCRELQVEGGPSLSGRAFARKYGLKQGDQVT